MKTIFYLSYITMMLCVCLGLLLTNIYLIGIAELLMLPTFYTSYLLNKGKSYKF